MVWMVCLFSMEFPLFYVIWQGEPGWDPHYKLLFGFGHGISQTDPLIFF